MYISLQLSNSNKNNIVNVHPFQSFHSIFSSSFPSLSPSDYSFVLPNNRKIPCSSSSSPDAEGIKEKDTILIEPILKGGGIKDFFRFFKKHWGIVIIAFIIALLPLFSLPSGLIPISASLLKVVMDETFEKVGLYLATNLGKYSLYNRLKFIIGIIKYVIFILIAYVSMTFPLLLLTCTLKGSEISASPTSLCSPSNAAFITGIVLTVLYMVIYSYFRGFGNVLDFFKGFYKKDQASQMVGAPITEGLHKTYDNMKYVSVSRNPQVGIYYVFLDKMADVAMSFVNTVVDIGCGSGDMSVNSFFQKFKSHYESIEDSKNRDNNIKIEIPKEKRLNIGNCCSPERYSKIGMLLYEVINKYTEQFKKMEIYTNLILVAIAFLEKAYPSSDSVREKEQIQEYLNRLELRLKEFSVENQQTYIPSNSGWWNHFLKVFFFYAICNLFTLVQNTSVTIQEMGGIYDVVDTLKSGSATGYYMAFFYFICLVALLICGIFDIY